MSLGFRADIEGLRGVAIIAVVAFHAGVPACTGGYVGVDVFFVLSGYLITGLLLREVAETGRLDLWNFYARRFRRLLPAMIVMVVATSLASVVFFAPMEQSRQISAAAIAASAYASNLYFAYGAVDYLGADSAPNPFLHTWSLSVEEQFYFAWPLVIWLLFFLLRYTQRHTTIRSVSQRKYIIPLGGIGIASLVFCILMTRHVQPWAFFLSPARAWEFALGALVLLVPPGRFAQALGIAGLGAIGLSTVAYDVRTVFPGFAALLPCVGTAAVIYAGQNGSPEQHSSGFVARFLSLSILRFFGKISYSWYLVHWPFLIFFSAAFPDGGLGFRVLAVAASLIAATASYRLVESPARSSPSLQPKKRAVAWALLASFTVVSGGALWRVWAARRATQPDQALYLAARTAMANKGCPANGFLDASPHTSCTTKPVHKRHSVVLFGDSHAGHWLPAMRLAAAELGWDVLIFTKSACPVAEVDFVHPGLGRTFHECKEWRRAVFAGLAEHPPDLLLLANSRWLITDNIGVSPADWQRGLEQTFAALKAVPRVRYLQDTPVPSFDVPACLARLAWAPFLPGRRCDFRWQVDDAVTKAERTAAAAEPNVAMVNFDDLVCPDGDCRAVRDGVIVFRDTNHMSAAFTERIAAQALARMSRALEEAPTPAP